MWDSDQFILCQCFLVSWSLPVWWQFSLQRLSSLRILNSFCNWFCLSLPPFLLPSLFFNWKFDFVTEKAKAFCSKDSDFFWSLMYSRSSHLLWWLSEICSTFWNSVKRCVCEYVYVSVRECECKNMHLWVFWECACVRVCECLCVCVSVSACVCEYMRVYMRICVWENVCVCFHVSVYVLWEFTCECVGMYMPVCVSVSLCVCERECYVSVCECESLCMWACLYIWLFRNKYQFLCKRVCECVKVCMYKCVRNCMWVCEAMYVWVCEGVRVSVHVLVMCESMCV